MCLTQVEGGGSSLDKVLTMASEMEMRRFMGTAIDIPEKLLPPASTHPLGHYHTGYLCTRSHLPPSPPPGGIVCKIVVTTRNNDFMEIMMRNETNAIRNCSKVLLHNGHTVYPEFLNCIRYAVEARIPSLTHNMKTTLKNICGNEFWNLLSRGEKSMAGWCMVHLVASGDLPLLFAEANHEYPKYYMLK